MELTQEYLKSILHYNPDTGVFTWKVRKADRTKIGDVAGSAKDNGYRYIRICGKPYFSHRLAWLYVHGVWPETGIDHRNGVRNDNRIVNLREATNSQNQQNQKKKHGMNTTSGYLGVTFDRRDKRWSAHIKASGKRISLGRFNCPTAAHFLGYLPAKRELHDFYTP